MVYVAGTNSAIFGKDSVQVTYGVPERTCSYTPVGGTLQDLRCSGYEHDPPSMVRTAPESENRAHQIRSPET